MYWKIFFEALIRKKIFFQTMCNCGQIDVPNNDVECVDSVDITNNDVDCVDSVDVTNNDLDCADVAKQARMADIIEEPACKLFKYDIKPRDIWTNDVFIDYSNFFSYAL